MARAVGPMQPSSRFASSLKPNVAYRVLNVCALWTKHTIGVDGVRGQSVPGSRSEVWRIGRDERMNALADGTVRCRQFGRLREHRALVLRLLGGRARGARSRSGLDAARAGLAHRLLVRFHGFRTGIVSCIQDIGQPDARAWDGSGGNCGGRRRSSPSDPRAPSRKAHALICVRRPADRDVACASVARN
jgi:hypothetical protein